MESRNGCFQIFQPWKDRHVRIYHDNHNEHNLSTFFQPPTEAEQTKLNATVAAFVHFDGVHFDFDHDNSNVFQKFGNMHFWSLCDAVFLKI